MTNLALTPDRPMLTLAGEVAFARGRVHEICGPARRTLAVMAAGRAVAMAGGDVVWAAPAWCRETLYPPAMGRYLAPERILLAACPRAIDLLWTAEEVLRSGAAAAVVVELGELPGLTALRRLQLAAEAGGGRVTGFLLTPGQGGAPGVESRWHIAPTPAARPDGIAFDAAGWRLHRLRARMAPEAAFALTWGGGGPAAHPVGD